MKNPSSPTPRKSTFKRLFALVTLGLVWGASACTTDDAATVALRKKLAEDCSLNSQCNSPLVCALGKCHNQCASSKDCGGARCVAADKPYRVCELPNTKRDCNYTSDCTQPHVCGVDGKCRAECADPRDCAGEQVCSYGTCADVDELVDGRLPLNRPEAATDRPCIKTSDCPEPLSCLFNRCNKQCVADTDCPQGRVCSNSACVVAVGGVTLDAGDASTGTGTLGAVCRRTSECQDAYSCVRGICDVECIGDRDCGFGQTCDTNGKCVLAPQPDGGPPPVEAGPTACTNLAKDGNETDVDCGGPCPPCGIGRTCLAAVDCASRRCNQGQCGPASCSDRVADGDETDVDCGGTACAPCAVGQACAGFRDCASFNCGGGVCLPGGCFDGTKNGSETDTDCGGPGCPGCTTGKVCTRAGDCASRVCSGVCIEPSCADNAKNGAETDTDCGGPACPKCSDQKVCLGAVDCTSASCINGRCQPPTCADNLQDGVESDVDCGGTSCPRCLTGAKCNTATDCLSGLCNANLCVTARCNDTLKNGTETDTDCGGPACAACGTGRTCLLDTDCASRRCFDGTCLAAVPLTVVRQGSGLGRVDAAPQIVCGDTCIGYIAQGTTIALHATPEPGVSFTGWSGPCTGTTDCIVTMDVAKTVTATFDTVGPDFIPLFVRHFASPHAITNAKLDPAGELVLFGRAGGAAVDFGYGPLTPRGGSRVFISRYSTETSMAGQPLWAFMYDDSDRVPVGMDVGEDGNPVFAATINDKNAGYAAIHRHERTTGSPIYTDILPIIARGYFSQEGYLFNNPDWFGAARNGDAITNSSSGRCDYDEGCSYAFWHDACRARVTNGVSSLQCIIRNLCNDFVNVIKLATGDRNGDFYFNWDALNRACDFGGGNRGSFPTAWILKQSSTGAYRWDRGIGGTAGTAIVHQMLTDSSNNLYLVGEFTGQIVVNAYQTLTSLGGSDGFILKLQGSNGAGLWGKRFGSTATGEAIRSISFGDNDEILIAGTYPPNAAYQLENITLPSRPSGTSWYVARLNGAGRLLGASVLGPATGAGTLVSISANGGRRRLVVHGTSTGAIDFGGGVAVPGAGSFAAVFRMN